MKDTLNFVGDGDDVDIVRDVECTFRIKLTNAEAERTITVGQLYDLIEMKYPDAGSRTPACLSQIAFYRVCQALSAMGALGKITPQTPISVLEGLEPPSIPQKWRRLAQSSGLDLPSLEGHSRMLEVWPQIFRSTSGWWLWGVLACAWAALGIFLVNLTVLASGLVVVPALYAVIHYVWWLVFRTVPQRLLTIGDLAREAAGCSFVKLSAEKNGCSPSDRWVALT